MSEKFNLDGVCCQYCANFGTKECPVIDANDWSRWNSFCNSYIANKEYKDAKELSFYIKKEL